MTARVCTSCGVEKDLQKDFSRHPLAANGYRRVCKCCNNKRRSARFAAHPEVHARFILLGRLSHYGLSPEQFETLIARQHNQCAICQISFAASPHSRRPHIDHCHASQIVRGLLCGQCNRGIGCFHDSADSLRRASLYVESPPTRIEITKRDSGCCRKGHPYGSKEKTGRVCRKCYLDRSRQQWARHADSVNQRRRIAYNRRAAESSLPLFRALQEVCR